MQQFSNEAFDFSDKSFPYYSLGARLLDKVFSENEIRKMSSSNESLEEIKKAFSKIIPFEQEEYSGIDLANIKLFDNGNIMKELPEAYYSSVSFQTGETRPPFEMLEKYISELAKNSRVPRRVDRSEMYERGCFVADFSDYLFRTHSNIGAICYYGSFIRGMKNPHDIDIAIFLKEVHPLTLVRDDTYRKEGIKSKELKDSKEFDFFRPTLSSLKAVADIDDVYFLVENYQKDENHLFTEMANNNTYEEEYKKNFKINAIVMPYERNFSTLNILGGNIWVLNSKENDNYRAFFSLGKEFSGYKSLHSDKTFVP